MKLNKGMPSIEELYLFHMANRQYMWCLFIATCDVNINIFDIYGKYTCCVILLPTQQSSTIQDSLYVKTVSVSSCCELYGIRTGRSGPSAANRISLHLVTHSPGVGEYKTCLSLVTYSSCWSKYCWCWVCNSNVKGICSNRIKNGWPLQQECNILDKRESQISGDKHHIVQQLTPKLDRMYTLMLVKANFCIK
jgi:hypothetical protein